MTQRTMKNECYSCKYKENIPGDTHVGCRNPDPEMKGNKHGIINGWFFYPFNFDPIWKTRDCNNYEEKK